MNWSRAKLSEVADIERDGIASDAIETGTRYLGLEHIEAGGKILGAATVEAGDLASTKFRFTSKHVLYGKLRPYLAKIAVPDFDGICSTDIVPIMPSPRLDRSFLTHFLRQPSMIEFANSRTTGANLPRLSPKALADFEIPLPPLEEQKRIAAILDQADELRRKRQRALDRLNQLGQAIFIEMFGDADSANSWNCDVVELNSICRKITDGTHQAPRWADSGIPFLFVSNIRNQRIDMDTKKFVSPEEFDSLTKHTKIEPDDILYTCVGSYGHTAVVDGSATFAFQRHIAHLKPKLDIVSPTYLAWCLETPQVKAQADKLATGIAQKTVTLSALKRFQVPLPNIKDQSEFEDRISEVLRLRSEMELEFQAQDRLFTSLQHRAFRGELTASSLKEAAA